MRSSLPADIGRYPAAAVEDAVEKLRTPFFLYEEDRIRHNCRDLLAAFNPLFERFRPLFAMKANPNPEVLRVVLDEGLELDASSAFEVWLARQLGAGGMFTGNFVSPRSWEVVLAQDDFILNLDDVSALDVIRNGDRPDALSFRVNPEMTGADLSCNQLGSRDAKFGIPREQVQAAYAAAAAIGLERLGIHAMSGSNVFEVAYFRQVTERLLALAVELRADPGVSIDFINVGGGFPVAYRPDDPCVDLTSIASEIRQAFDSGGRALEREPALYVEPGRRITGDAGWLVTTVTSVKRGHKTFVGVDASTADLPRPQIYGAYHHISVLGREPEAERTETVDVVGSVCETTDRLATDRTLPTLEPGDVLVFHNSGAHAFAMTHNYNGRLRCAEYLARSDRSLQLIRRAERFEDLIDTVPAGIRNATARAGLLEGR